MIKLPGLNLSGEFNFSDVNDKEVNNMFKKLFTKIKAIINDIDYECWNTRIMSDALEFDIDENTVEKWLDANYKNHYERKN